MRVALVTGATGLVGRSLVARLRAEGVRVLATARTLAAGSAVREAGAEPLHTDVANIGSWEREAKEAEAIFHLALPRLDPPLRRAAARRRARPARAAASALLEVVAGRPVVMLSSAFAYGDRSDPAADEDAAAGRIPAVAAAALATEEILAPASPRIVRVPWVHGPGGIMRDLVEGLRMRSHRIVGAGDNPWSMIGADDAAAALVAALALPPGRYSAAEPAVPTQEEVVEAICAVPGHRRPDRVPSGLAAVSMGGAVSEALGMSLLVRTGRLADHGWAPRDDWRTAVTRLAEGPLPPRA